MMSAVLDHLWQSTLFALAVGLLALGFRKARAAVRYGLWFAASAKFLIPFAALAALGRVLAPALRPPLEATPGAAFIEQATQPFSQAGPASPVAYATAPAASAAIAPDPISPAAHATTSAAHAAIALDPALILLAAWALGCAAVLVFWATRWAKVRSAVRAATPLAFTAPMPILASSWMREPGLVGVRRPVLLVPETLFDHLDRPEIEALVAHEACHLRRRDNLTATMHMLVEALFWFHPLVWWIGARLIDERERACDEAVVQSGHDRAAYARSLVECCRLYLQSPLSCVAGASGSYLRRRVEAIMTAPLSSPLSRSGKTLLIAAGACALASPVAAGWLASPTGRQAAAQVAVMASAAAAAPAEEPATAGRISEAAAAPEESGSGKLIAAAQDDEASTSSSAVAQSVAAWQDGPAPATERMQPSPGAEDAIRRWISKTQLHQPDDEDMSPALAGAARQQATMTMQMFTAVGPVKDIRFVRATTDGEDAYEVDFAHAKIEVLAGPLTADGKLDRLRWRPIWAADGATSGPGVPPAPLASADVSPPPATDVAVSKAPLIPVSARTPDAEAPPPAAAVTPDSAPGALITDPVWVRLPPMSWGWSGYVYPAGAERRELPGRAVLRCRVDNRGGLNDCVVRAETPAGMGFGKEALLLIPRYRLRTTAADGTRVQGRLVDVPMEFTPKYYARIVDDHGSENLSKPQVVRWVTSPFDDPYVRAAERYYPTQALSEAVAAEVTLHCKAKPDGRLSDCAVAHEFPKGLGFGRLALLAKPDLLKVESRALDGSPIAGRTIEVRYVFNPPCDVAADREERRCGAGPGHH